MPEVPFVVVQDIARMLRSRNIDPEVLVAGLKPQGLGILAPAKRVPWTEVRRVLEQTQDFLHGAHHLRVASRELDRSISPFQRLLTGISDPKLLHVLGAQVLGPAFFPMTRAQSFGLEDGRYAQRIEFLPGYESCPAFFHYLHGMLESAPVDVGTPSVEIELCLESESAVFAFNYPYTPNPLTRSKGILQNGVHALDMVFGRLGVWSQDFAGPSAPESSGDLATRVKMEIDRNGASEAATLSEIARRLGMSARSLRRGLNDEGTSFRMLRDARRQERALELLQGDLGNDAIAEELGFSDERAFRRAFRRWTGRIPSDFRDSSVSKLD